MASIPQHTSPDDARTPSRVKLLNNGDKMKQPEFHRLYERMPEHYKAELIGGIVFEPSPLSYPHGEQHVELSFLLATYSKQTPGLGVADNVTVILGEDDEVQPDLIMRCLAERRGRSHLTEKKYVQGPPELVAEIALSSKSIDLHLKKNRYALAGVMEYIVVCIQPRQLRWFDLRKDTQIKAGRDGIFRSRAFPGLWIHGEGLLHGNSELTLDALHKGLRSSEHESFRNSIE